MGITEKITRHFDQKELNKMQLTENQKILLEKILKMPRGTILRKGKTERILWGAMPGMIAYKTKSSKTKVTCLNVFDFMAWAEKAELVE